VAVIHEERNEHQEKDRSGYDNFAFQFLYNPFLAI